MPGTSWSEGGEEQHPQESWVLLLRRGRRLGSQNPTRVPCRNDTTRLCVCVCGGGGGDGVYTLGLLSWGP